MLRGLHHILALNPGLLTKLKQCIDNKNLYIQNKFNVLTNQNFIFIGVFIILI